MVRFHLLPRFPLGPFLLLGLGSLLSAALVLALASRQPWTGLEFMAPAEGPGLMVTSVDPQGPAAMVAPGVRVFSIASGDAPDAAVGLQGGDVMEEPDALPTIAAMRAFFGRQDLLHDILASGASTGTLHLETDAGPVEIGVAQTRPLGDLPDIFWVQIVTGLAGCWLGGWVLALRRREAPARYLALAGIGLAISAHGAALYSSRELALTEGLFYWASAFNTLGAIVFGIGMINLFLIYPVRLVPRWVERLVLVIFGTWAALAFFRLTGTTALMIHVPIMVELVCIASAAIAQTIVTRGNPQARAALRWFGLSVVIGGGSFIALITAPTVFGYTPQVKQGHAFAGFLLVYVGLAIGVARYRLFELEDWAFRILFYTGGVMVLLAMDVLLISLVALDRLPAFSIALLVVAFIYLPARDAIARVLAGRRALSNEALFDLVSRVALAQTPGEQRARLESLLAASFDPLEILPSPAPVDTPVIRDAGEVMDLPGIDRTPALRMRWMRRGRRLFSPQDARRAASIMAITQQLLERRQAYEAGAAEERGRITRDIHDNIGLHLMGALHSASQDRKDVLVRQALADLREIISNTEGDTRLLDDLLADLRAELAEHLEAASIVLDWQVSGLEAPMTVGPKLAATLRAVLREAVNNAIRHAAPGRIEVAIDRSRDGSDHLVIRVTDDGTGPPGARDTTTPTSGQGLVNLRRRTEAMGGELVFGAAPTGRGSVLSARVVLSEPGNGPEHAAPQVQDQPHALREA
jgi:signal transduction histidine kinase